MAMRVAFRHFLLDRGGALYRLPSAALDRMLQTPTRHRLPRLAGQRVRIRHEPKSTQCSCKWQTQSQLSQALVARNRPNLEKTAALVRFIETLEHNAGRDLSALKEAPPGVLV
jgi:hypothetical protein